MKIGCHAVLFRERIATETEAVLKGISEAGYAGFEMGARFFDVENAGRFTELLSKYNLELTGLHVGTSAKACFEQPEELGKNLLQAAQFIKDFPNKNIILSGNDTDVNENRAQMVELIQQGAKMCKDLGVQVHYHNHAPEFRNNCDMFYALVENAPDLQFAIDTGWVHIAGADLMKILTENASRIDYIHLRDPRATYAEGEDKFADMGEGCFDYPKLMTVVKQIIKDDQWAIIEYENGEVSFDRYKKAKKMLDGVLEGLK